MEAYRCFSLSWDSDVVSCDILIWSYSSSSKTLSFFLCYRFSISEAVSNTSNYPSSLFKHLSVILRSLFNSSSMCSITQLLVSYIHTVIYISIVFSITSCNYMALFFSSFLLVDKVLKDICMNEILINFDFFLAD